MELRSVSDPSYAEEKKQMESSIQDAPQQRNETENIVIKPDSSSDHHEPLTKTMVSLTTLCVLFASAETFSRSHLHVPLTSPLSFSLACCLSISALSFLKANALLAQTHTSKHANILSHKYTFTHAFTPTVIFD